MNKILILFMLLNLSICTIAQNSINVISEKSTINLLEEVSLKEQFLDPEFISGKVFFKDGSVSSALLNYNLLLNTILFVGDNDIALTLSELNKISLVSYGKHKFIPYNNSFMEIVGSYKNDVILLLDRKVKVKDNKKVGLYGDSMETSAFTNITSYDNKIMYRDFSHQINIDIIQNYSYYICVKSKFYKIQRVKDILKIFPEKKDSVLDYINNNNLKPSIIFDLDKIISYCTND